MAATILIKSLKSIIKRLTSNSCVYIYFSSIQLNSVRTLSGYLRKIHTLSSRITLRFQAFSQIQFKSAIPFSHQSWNSVPILECSFFTFWLTVAKADVPFFLHGHNAWVEGIGEKITPLELPQGRFVVVRVNAGLETGRIRLWVLRKTWFSC